MWANDTRALCQQIVATLETSNSTTMREMTAFRALLRVPAYPEYALEEVLKLPVYQYRGGQVRTVIGSVEHDSEKNVSYIAFQSFGFQSPTIRLRYFTENGEGPFELPGTQHEDRFYYTRPSCKKPVVAFEVKDSDGSPVLFGGPML
jgi:hypothetical protein